MSSAVLVVSDDHGFRKQLPGGLEEGGFKITHYRSHEFSVLDCSNEIGCVLIDATSDAEEGLEFLRRLRGPAARRLKAIVISARASVPFAVEAAKAGAFDVLHTPLDQEELRSCVRDALASLEPPPQSPLLKVSPKDAAIACDSLTRRQREVLKRILDGQPNKIIAADLGISQRTAENHRAMVMRKLGASSISDLIQIALAAGAEA